MKFGLTWLAAFAFLSSCAGAIAQDQVIGADPAPAAPVNAWATSCGSQSRGTPLNCQLSQRAISSQTRRPVATVTLRFPAGGPPIMVLSTPVGVSLAAGLTYDVDGTAKQTLAFEACDANECFASAALSAELLAAMQAGQKFNLSVQNVQKQPVVIPMSLGGFTAAYNSVK